MAAAGGHPFARVFVAGLAGPHGYRLDGGVAWRGVGPVGPVLIGLGAAGFVDSARATMLFAPNLAWRDEPLKQRVEERLGREVVVENDANASAWAEARFGAARGYRDVMLVALGTGIGAAIIIGGELYRGRWGIAGEPGHIRVVPDGRLCGCGNRGCWEQYCSGRALEREAREIVSASAVTGADLLARAGGAVEAITGHEAGQSALAGEADGLAILAEHGADVALGLGGLVNILDPELVVIGGGLVHLGEVLLAPIRAAMSAHVEGASRRTVPPVVAAALGEQAGAVGAAALARTLVPGS